MTLQEPQHRRPVGRPRSAQAHQAIITATLELLAEEGFDGMSLEAVATRAGVGKTTIYRRWPSKEALVIDAMREQHTEMPVADTGNLRADMVTLLREEVSQAANPLQAKLLFRVAGEIFAHPELFSVVFHQQLAPRLKHMEQLIERAQARGELRQDLDAPFMMGLILGPLLYHALVSTMMPVPHTLDELPELIFDAVLHGIDGHLKEE
jgi:AcrR family transcriptional regulator